MCSALQFLLHCMYVCVCAFFIKNFIPSVSLVPQNTHIHVSLMHIECAQYNRLLSMFFKKYNKSWTKVKVSHSNIHSRCVSFLIYVYRPVISVFYSIFMLNIRSFYCELIGLKFLGIVTNTSTVS